METFIAIILYALAVTLLLAIIYAVKSARLQHRFGRMGVLKGRSLDEIIKFVGQPSHRARLGPHREVLEWRRVGFHIALMSTDNVCDGVEQVNEA